MFDSEGALLYVGKAKSLRKRLASYFRKSSKPHRKAEMIRRIARIDVFLVRNEREALVLESNLIRHMKPRYTSRFTRKGDSYYYIALSDEPFPRLVPFRKERVNFALQDIDGRHTKLFGPYIGWRLRNHLLKTVTNLVRLRTCHSLPAEACARWDDGVCFAPCITDVTEETYHHATQSAGEILQSPPKALLDDLTLQMRDQAASQAYGEATRLRDAIRSLEHAAMPQAVELPRRLDAIVIWMDDYLVAHLTVRNGRTLGLGYASSQDIVSTFSGEVRGERIISNRPFPESLTDSDAMVNRTEIPRTAGSDIGQLLEICRINHAHETQRRWATSP